MARTIQDINQDLKDRYIADSTVQSFYNFTPGNTFDDEFSIVSFEGILFYIIAFSIWTLEKIFDDHKAWMYQKEAELKPWSLPYLEKNAKSFQFGYSLQYIDDKYQYSVIDPAAQLIKLASAKEVGRLVVLKLAGIDSNGNPQQLSSAVLTAFQPYISALKPPGVRLSIVTRPADSLQVYYLVYIDPLVLNTNGELLSNTSVKPVEIAINEYCKGFTFDGTFSVTGLTDYIQMTVGVVDPVFQSGATKFGTQPYIPLVNYYEPNSGYMEIDPLYPLSTTIQYVVL
jgi:hypothetical protein